MKYLPIFINLNKRSILVVGGGIVAARKVKMLLKTGADIKVVACLLCPELLEMLYLKQFRWIGKKFNSFMLNKIYLVIVATDDKRLNKIVYHYSVRRHLLINVVDCEAKCSFIFPSIVDRDPVIVAISSSGKAPVLTRMLREKFEALLPMFLGTIAHLAGKWRLKVKEYFVNSSDRRLFWERIFNGYFVDYVAQRRIKQANYFLYTSLGNIQKKYEGSVTLVGAGPGDASLFTLRGLQCVQEADVVLYDYLVGAKVIDLIRRDAKCICVGKRAGHHFFSQEKINNLLVNFAHNGYRVVRLKGGDPFVFGRGAEELQCLADAGVTFQVVPGIPSVIGASAYSGIPLTHRGLSRGFVCISGNSVSDIDSLNWMLLAKSNYTIVIYMGSSNATEISEKLIFYGKNAKTPAAIISRATCVDQQVRVSTLDHLGSLALLSVSPSLFIIGEVVSLHSNINWFNNDNNIKAFDLFPIINLF